MLPLFHSASLTRCLANREPLNIFLSLSSAPFFHYYPCIFPQFSLPLQHTRISSFPFLSPLSSLLNGWKNSSFSLTLCFLFFHSFFSFDFHDCARATKWAQSALPIGQQEFLTNTSECVEMYSSPSSRKHASLGGVSCIVSIRFQDLIVVSLRLLV